jgi:hypothetical protein
VTCPIEGCIRGEGVEWGSGPTLCVPHRAEWAADHEKEISDGEWEHWANEYAYDTPGGRTLSTWPDNFKTMKRPTREELKSFNDWAREIDRMDAEAAEKEAAKVIQLHPTQYPEGTT